MPDLRNRSVPVAVGGGSAEAPWYPGFTGLVVAVALILAVGTFPAGFPSEFNVGSVPVNVDEPGMLFAALLVRATGRHRTRLGAEIYFFSIGVVVAATISVVLLRLPVNKVLFDIRGMLRMILCFVVARSVYRSNLVGPLRRVTVVVLWISAVELILSSVAGFSVSGRSETAALDTISGLGSGDATRLLTDTSTMAAPILTACFATALAGRASLRKMGALVIPAALICLLAFSRNMLVGLAAAVVVLFFVSSPRKFIFRAFVLGIWVLSLVLAGALVGPAGRSIPGVGWVAIQLNGYVSRVIDGLSAQAFRTDTSIGYRLTETSNLFASFRSSPLFGHGFGFAYQPPQGPPGTFWGDQAPYYAHDFYLWLAVKTGILGLALFALFVARLLLPGLRTSSGGRTWAVAGVVSLLASSIAAPALLGLPGSVAMGVFLGLASAARDRQKEVVDRPISG